MHSMKTFRLGCSISMLGVLTGILFCLSLTLQSTVSAEIFGINSNGQFVNIDPTTGIQTPVSNVSSPLVQGVTAVDYDTHQMYIITSNPTTGTTHITSINTQTGQVVISPAMSSGINALAFDPGISSVEQANQYTDAQLQNQEQRLMYQVDHEINQLERKLSRGIAAAAALSNVTPYVPGVTAVNMGSAYYNGKMGVGLTASRWSSNGLWNFNSGVAFAGSANSTIIRVGIGFLFK